MARIYVMTSGMTGILHASFELVRQLQAAGHNVLYACPLDKKAHVQAQGIQYLQLPEVNYYPGKGLVHGGGLKAKLTRWGQRWLNPQKLFEDLEKEFKMQEFKDSVKSFNPHLLLLDIEVHQHLITAVSRGWPVVLLSHWFTIWDDPGIPHPGSMVVPGQNWKGTRWAIAGAWKWIKLKRFLGNTWRFVRSWGLDRRSLLTFYAHQIGFPRRYFDQLQWLKPLCYKTLPVAAISADTMDFPVNDKPWLHYVGPMVHVNRSHHLPEMQEITRQVETLCQRAQSNAQPIIYCSVISMNPGNRNFLKRFVQAVKDQTHWLVFMGLGDLLDIDFLPSLPPHIKVLKWAPQLTILKYASCSINHGGIHTINECLHFQVPMLIYSGKRHDQNGCAARIVYHGLGLSADPDRDTPEEIASKVKSVLSNGEIKDRLQEEHERYIQTRQKQEIVRLVEKYQQPAAIF